MKIVEKMNILWVMSSTNGQQYQDLQASVCQNVAFMHYYIATLAAILVLPLPVVTPVKL